MGPLTESARWGTFGSCPQLSTHFSLHNIYYRHSFGSETNRRCRILSPVWLVTVAFANRRHSTRTTGHQSTDPISVNRRSPAERHPIAGPLALAPVPVHLSVPNTGPPPQRARFPRTTRCCTGRYEKRVALSMAESDPSVHLSSHPTAIHVSNHLLTGLGRRRRCALTAAPNGRPTAP